MFKLVTILVFVFFLLSEFTYSANPIPRIINCALASVLDFNSGAYKIEYRKRKLFGNGDTTKEITFVSFKKVSKDSFNLNFYIRNFTKNIIDLYNGNSYAIIECNKKEINLYEPTIVKRNKFNGFPWSSMLCKSLLNPVHLKGLLDNIIKDSLSLIDSTTMIDNDMCYVLKDHLNDTLDAHNMYVYYYIRKSDCLPVREVFRLDFQDQVQYTEYNISDIVINKVDTNLFKFNDNDYKGYTITDNTQLVNNNRPKILRIDTTAPIWKLPSISVDSLSLNMFKGKVVVMDFWYMSCYPCLKALPVLQKLQDKYNDKLIVIGINAYDTDTVKLKQFLKYRSITYRQTYNAQSVALMYGVTAYPTLYIIDKMGVIKTVDVGYSDELEAKIDRQISDLK